MVTVSWPKPRALGWSYCSKKRIWVKGQIWQVSEKEWIGRSKEVTH